MEERKTYTNIPLLDKLLNGEKIDSFTVSLGLDGNTLIKPIIVVMLGVIVAVLVAKFL